MRGWPLFAVPCAFGWGCREAVTPTGPGPHGPNLSPPAVATFPGRDTTVDSIGLLNIEVKAHDASLIDTVTLLITGAPLAFPPQVVNDTAFDGVFTIALGALHHRPFSFRAFAGNILGRDTLTDSVTVRLR